MAIPLYSLIRYKYTVKVGFFKTDKSAFNRPGYKFKLIPTGGITILI